MQRTNIPIAIVGMSAIFPGSAGARGFWNDILDKKDSLIEVPRTHWLVEDYYDPDPKAPDKTYARRGAFLSDTPFDPMTFGIPPNQLEATDSGQLLALLVAKQVLEDAYRGQFASADKSRISVVLGTTGATELILEMASRMERPRWAAALREEGMDEAAVERVCDRIAASYVEWQESSFPGLLPNVVAGRIAHKLDLGGANYITDAACASSFAAMHAGLNELYLGQSDLVITGGVDALNTISMFMCFSKTPALSPTGDCRPFSADADGTMLGEGLGMVALKRLADAERDGDAIYAVVRGLGHSSDGKGSSVYAPVPEGQARALRRAYDAAGYSPSTVELIEAHGTATKAGDAAEAQALQSVFERNASAEPRCALGSVKSNIGHTKAAAGVAGLIKVVMALQHKVLPPTIKVSAPNAKLNLEASAFYLNTEARPWIRGASHPRRASVSSFGFGGTNFHVAVEEYKGPGPLRPRLRRFKTELCLFSAATGAALADLCRKAIDGCKTGVGLQTLAEQSRRRFNAAEAHRLAVVAADASELGQKIGQALEKLNASPDAAFTLPGGVYYNRGPRRETLGFLFPGQGSQYVNMGADLAMAFDQARGVWDDAAELDVWSGGAALHQVVFPAPGFTNADREAQEARLKETHWAQPAISNASVAQLRLLRALGLEPRGYAGHSLGELTALHAAGVFDHETLVSVARRRGELMKEAAGAPGSMLAVKAEANAIEPLLGEMGTSVAIANYNAPSQTILAGATGEIAAVKERLEANSLACVLLPVATAFHSPIVATAVEPFQTFLDGVAIESPAIPVYSNFDGAPYPSDHEALRRRLGEQLAQPVRFIDQIERMYADGVRVFVEVGPQATLTSLVNAILTGREYTAIALDRKNQDGVTSLWQALGQLAVAGYSLDLARLFESYEEPLPAPAKPAGTLSVLINGANYGKLYPPREGAAKPASRPVAPAKPLPPAPPPPPPIETPPAHQNGHHTAASADWISVFQQAQQQTLEAHTMFQRTMAESHQAFLKTAELSIMGLTTGLTQMAPPAFELPAPAIIRSQPVLTGPPAAPPPIEVVTPVLPKLDLESLTLNVVSEKTGYPVEMLSLEMELDNDLGIDSIKRVEIFASLMERTPELQALEANELAKRATLGQIVEYIRETLGDGASTAGPLLAAVAAPALDLHALMLQVVSEKTGYPAEMLSPEMELDNDLGIDSIKRVEIFATLMERAPELQSLDTGELAKRPTLAGIVAYIESHLRGGAAQVVEPRVEAKLDRATEHAVALVERFALEWSAAPASGWRPTGLQPGARVVATEDGGGVAQALAARLGEHGLNASVITARAVEAVSDADAVIFLGGLAPVADFAAAQTIQREAFAIARAIAPRFAARGGVFVAVQDTGGRFGVEGISDRAALGGLAGLAKTADLEWPQASVKAIDLERGGRTPEELAHVLADELLAGGLEREVGLTADSSRGTPVSVRRACDAAISNQLPRGAFLVVTGGARGVTAASLAALAAKLAPRLLILGRTPPEEEPASCAGATDEAALKRVLLDDARTRGESLTPAELNARVARLLANREIRASLRELEAAGAQTRYASVDARDGESLRAALDAARAEWGPIDGVIHGAGVLADKLIAEKKDEQFERVFSTKVDGLHGLLEATAGDPLRLICLFSSVAGRMGNAGQCDYAMANETINKIAALERARRGGACLVKSINWGPWESGMVTPRLKARFAEMGVPLIPLDVGARMFVEELEQGPPGEIEVLIGGGAPLLQRREVHLTLSSRTHGFLGGHRIKGETVVPFTVVHEWFSRLCRSARPDLCVAEIREMRAYKGIVPRDFDGAGETLTINLSPRRVARGEAQFDVELRGGETLHYQGVAFMRETLEQKQSRQTEQTPADWPAPEIYDGEVLFHRDAFRVIRSIQGYGEDGIVGELGGASNPAQMRDAILLDGALQLAVLWHWRRSGGGSLPVAIESVKTYGEFGAEPLRCEVRGRAAGPQRAVVDLTVSRSSGEIVAEISGLELVVYFQKQFTTGAAS